MLVTWDPFTFAILFGESRVRSSTRTSRKARRSRKRSTRSPDSSVSWLRTRMRRTSRDSRSRGWATSCSRPIRCRSGPTCSSRDGDNVKAGDIIAKIPRETTKTKDIVGGLPRVVELFEARRPGETAVMCEINGVVKFGPIAKGKRKIIITGDDGSEREYDIPRGTHINVQEDDRVRSGEPLMDGPLNPHDILRVLGMEALQNYLVNEIQEVYRLQGVNINDKHIEVIVRQMLRWVKIKEVGDTDFLLEEQVDRFRYEDENRPRSRTRRARHRSANRCCSALRRLRFRPTRSFRQRASRRRPAF